MKWFDWMATGLVLVGAFNWGLVGFFNFNLVTTLVPAAFVNYVYDAVGIAAVISAFRLATK
jgi:uncharacterized membrane protein YuzA (DUF378 family)